MHLANSKQTISFVCLVFLILVTTPAMADELTVPRLTDWLDAYGEAWETRNADAAVKIFAEDATYQVTPYEEPHVGQDGIHSYWTGVTENQRNVQFEYEILGVTGNTGFAHWTANFDVEGGPNIDLNGVFVLEFDEDGKYRQLREWWHLQSHAAAEQD